MKHITKTVFLLPLLTLFFLGHTNQIEAKMAPATVGNSWVETAYQLSDSAEEIQDAQDSNHDGNKAVSTYKAVKAAGRAAQLAKSVAQSASDAASFGFYASLDYSHSESNTTLKDNAIIAQQSTTHSDGNIFYNAGNNNIIVQGSDIQSHNGDLSFTAKDVAIVSKQEIQTNTTDQSNHHWSKTIASTSAGKMALDAMLPTYGEGQSDEKNETITHRHSTITAKNGHIHIQSQDDITIKGADVSGKTVSLTAGDDISIQSVQNTTQRNKDGESWSVGNQMSYGSEYGKTDRQWTDQQTVVMGEEKTTIVADHVANKGAIISSGTREAQLDENGEPIKDELGNILYTYNDANNLEIRANSYTTQDLDDHYYHYDENYSVGASMGGNHGQDPQSHLANPNVDRVSAQAQNGGFEWNQTTKAGTGKGRMILRNTETQVDTHGNSLHHHLDNTRTDQSQVELGGWDTDLSLSYAELTNPLGELQKDIDAISELPGNAIQAGNRVADAATDLAHSVAKNGINIFAVNDQYNDKTARREALAQMTPQELDVIANPHHYGETVKKGIADKYAHIYSEIRGIDAANSNFYDSELLNDPQAIDDKGLDKRDMVAFSDGNAENDEIYYEADKINEEDHFARALGHENKRQDQIENGIINHSQDGISSHYDREATDAGDHNLDALQREMGYKGVDRDTDRNITYIPSLEDMILVANGTQKANTVQESQPMIMAMPINGVKEQMDSIPKPSPEEIQQWQQKLDNAEAQLFKFLDATDTLPQTAALGTGLKTLSKTPEGIAILSAIIKETDPKNVHQLISVLKKVVNKNAGGAKKADDFFEGTKYTNKVKRQMKQDDFHSFPESVTGFPDAGKVTKLKGGDGVVRDKLEIPGNYRGRDGNFEFIKEPENTINHRLFRPNKE